MIRVTIGVGNLRKNGSLLSSLATACTAAFQFSLARLLCKVVILVATLTVVGY